MSLALEITLILVLLSLAVGLTALLIQLRRTAHGMELFLASARRDLAQITEDVHASRLRMDSLASSLAVSLGEVAIFTRSLSEVGGSVREWHGRIRTTLDSASRTIGSVIGGLSAALAFFKSKPTHHPSD